MNELHPVPLTFPPASSQADTLEACKKYKVKPPSLNADFLEETLKKTTIDPDVQASIVRGWREGFDLGSHLPAENHFAKDAKYRTEAQNNTLMKNLEEEKVAGIMHGPMTEPYVDGRWFHNYWVSPYFVIPKTTPEGAAQRWRLIHHLSFHNSGERWQSLNGHIDLEEYPTYFPTVYTEAHLVFCLANPGSALIGRDIRNYYRNFLVNPYCWWQTYTYVLGSYWFNPYLPFGASSCTAIAQRQSDRIRTIATVYGVEAMSVAMLDDFLLVCKRRFHDSDETVLDRGRREEEKFDSLLAKLNLPKAPEKDQPSNFKTTWFGCEFNSKETTLGVPHKK